MDTCIKAGSYCPVCKGVVGRDCWHDASEFKRGANYAEEFFAAKDEIESLRQQLASAQEELHFQACLTRDLMPYQERALKSEQQLAAANHLIAEQNKLSKERQEWALKNNETIRGMNEQLAAALAACALQRKALLGTVAYLSAAASAYEKFVGRHGVRGHPDALFLTRYADFIAAEKRGREALAIQPDASILKAHDDALIERCAQLCERCGYDSVQGAEDIRQLKGGASSKCKVGV